MTADQRLLYETRVRPRQAVIAAIAAIGLIGAAILQLLGPHAHVNELTLGLITEHKRVGAGHRRRGASRRSVTWRWRATLVFLVDSTKARAPQQFSWIKYLALVGGGLAAIAGVASAVVISIKAHQFVTTGDQTYEQAHALTSSATLVAPQLAAQAASLLLAVSTVLIALQAMRVGLLPRFLGYLGMFAGVLIILPIVQLPIVQAYFLGALAYLFSGRWPSGVPPAWRTGNAEPWPTSQAMRQQRAEAAASRRGRGRGRGKPAPTRRPSPSRWQSHSRRSRGAAARLPSASASAAADNPRCLPGRVTSAPRLSRPLVGPAVAARRALTAVRRVHRGTARRSVVADPCPEEHGDR